MVKSMFNIQMLGKKKTQAFLVATNIKFKVGAKQGIGEAGRHLQNEVKLSVSGHKAEPASVDTGRFLNSVDMVQDGLTATIFTPLDYPKYLEHGTSRIPARRHFGNSLDRNKGAIQDIIKSNIKGM